MGNICQVNKNDNYLGLECLQDRITFPGKRAVCKLVGFARQTAIFGRDFLPKREGDALVGVQGDIERGGNFDPSFFSIG